LLNKTLFEFDRDGSKEYPLLGTNWLHYIRLRDQIYQPCDNWDLLGLLMYYVRRSKVVSSGMINIENMKEQLELYDDDGRFTTWLEKIVKDVEKVSLRDWMYCSGMCNIETITPETSTNLNYAGTEFFKGARHLYEYLKKYNLFPCEN
jgi:hypothetical protein